MVGFVVLAGFLFSGCAQTAKDAPAPFTTETATPEGYSFPHPSDAAEPTVHGLWVVRSGRSLCAKCHKSDTDTSLPGPSCTSCHTVYPHADGWVSKTAHGKYVIDNGQTKCQTACHGTDLTGGLSGISCTKCHATYPHVTGWATALLHGITARTTDGKNICKLCHGDTFTGGQSETACSDCHVQYPHATGWVSATAGASVHGPIVNTEGSAQCQNCHGTNNTGSIFSSFCNTCHNQHLSSPTTCKPCHEAGKGLPSGSYRPSDSIHPATTDCVGCHDYATGDFTILRGETTDFTQSPHASTTGAFMKESDSTSCMRCHTSTGFKDYIHDESMDALILGSDVPDPLTCTSCHNADTANYSNGVTFITSGFVPGDNPKIYRRVADGGGGEGKHVDLTVGREGICIRCHAPRSSDGAIKINTWLYNGGFTAAISPDLVLTTSTTPKSSDVYYFPQYPANNTATPAGTLTTSTSNKRSASVTFHYLPILATFYGNDAKEGFQYATDPNNNVLTYVGKNNLMTGYETCIDCHNPHTTEVQPAKCVSCHAGVTTTADFPNIRVTTSDYDGDGSTSEGISDELNGVKAKLYTAIQNYTKYRTGLAGEIELATVTITSPYAQSKGSWYVKGAATAYAKWTPRLVKACYNYHLSFRDSAAYVHNSKYMIQLMYDSLKDLNTALADTTLMSDAQSHSVDMTGMVRP